MVNPKYKVVDNFLSEKIYKELRDFLYSEKISWYYRSEETDNTSNTDGFFAFCWYNSWAPDHASFHTHIKPILETLNCIAPIQVRANMTFLGLNKESCGWHTDYDFKEFKTAIIYFTTCNAQTLLKIDDDIVKVSSVENRIVIFDGNIEHKVEYGNNYTRRIVINLNWF